MSTDEQPCGPGETAEPTNIVIFGAAGDLTQRKLIPALLRMLQCGLIHPESRVVGVVNNRSESQWLALVRDGIREFASGPGVDDEAIQKFFATLKMVPGDLKDETTYERLRDSLETIGGRKNAMFYCAIPPQWYSVAARGLHRVGLVDESEGYRRIVIEKPFGLDLQSARELNLELQSVIDESQIYRIDHYLGKESVQNLLVYRFANSIMEPLWNRNYIDHIQIFAAETIGIENRAKYYEESGALRDMIQSHLMQVMTLVAMEPPVEFTADAVRDEKMKVLRAVRPFDAQAVQQQTVAAQYASGTLGNENIPAYADESGVAPGSTTETFAGVRFYIDNWRWKGVPFILWSGKRLEQRASEVMIRFRNPPFNLFDSSASVPEANTMIFRLHPDSGVELRMNAKKQGLTTDTQRLVMHAPYADENGYQSDAYEVLMHDVLSGDSTLFSRGDEVERSWDIIEPILQELRLRDFIDSYPSGTWDIAAMDELLAGCVGGWHKPT